MRAAVALAFAGALFALAVGAADERSVVSWETLAQVSVTRQKDRYVPQFSPQILALDRREVKLKGFMTPLEQAAGQKHFLLSALPSDCAFCVPGSAEQFAEVLAKKPVKYTNDPITVSGTFALVRDDSGGLLYRLTEAVMIEK